mmetsp:Transcript_13481/g.43910  ORF Transcript_13481/g.43910 Transcript_13481/m.43910 type:complete len:228 (+) Transcript_13481:327-1010(+)
MRRDSASWPSSFPATASPRATRRRRPSSGPPTTLCATPRRNSRSTRADSFSSASPSAAPPRCTSRRCHIATSRSSPSWRPSNPSRPWPQRYSPSSPRLSSGPSSRTSSTIDEPPPTCLQRRPPSSSTAPKTTSSPSHTAPISPTGSTPFHGILTVVRRSPAPLSPSRARATTTSSRRPSTPSSSTPSSPSHSSRATTTNPTSTEKPFSLGSTMSDELQLLRLYLKVI